MKKLSFFILIAVFFQPNAFLSTHFVRNSSIQNVKLCTFTTIPKDVMGCVCYFYLTREDEKKRVYIMAENFAQEGYVSINNKIQKFELVSFKDKNYYLYNNGVYNLKVEFKNKISSESENFRVVGVITLLKGSKVIDVKKIIGECAC